jgi:hypothetical protein
VLAEDLGELLRLRSPSASCHPVTVQIKRLPWVTPRTNIVNGFLPWRPWAECYLMDVPGQGESAHAFAGVYMFALSARRPTNPVDFLDPRIKYVGESGRLRKRFAQYARWVTNKWGWAERHTWITAFPIRFSPEVEDPNLSLQLRLYTERRILWERAQRGLETYNLR